MQLYSNLLHKTHGFNVSEIGTQTHLLLPVQNVIPNNMSRFPQVSK